MGVGDSASRPPPTHDPQRARVGSLAWRMLGGMALPMTALALALGFGGTVAIRSAVERVNDRILGAASRAMADSLFVEDGRLAMNLSPAIFGMLEDAERDNIYYSVRQDGRLLSGYAGLPVLGSHRLGDTEVAFGYVDFRGRQLRAVAEGRRLAGIGSPVVVEVAETLGARERSARSLLTLLAGLELALVGLTALLLPLAVRWGLRPLAALRAEMDRRVASDLDPLPLNGVPAELRELLSAFNALLARVDATFQGMRRFTADASHQMRTPLSILRTQIALLRRADPAGAEAATFLEDIDRATDRLQRLLVQLLALARADHATLVPEAIEPVPVDAFAAEVAATHAPAAIRAGLDIRFDASGTDSSISTHRALAAELLGNLLDNAIRHNRTGGTVRVAVEPDVAGRTVVVLIEDDGQGIPPEDRERVFTRFVRLGGEASSLHNGSGLGLPIAASLARAIGAAIELSTPPTGTGLRAAVRFPAASPV